MLLLLGGPAGAGKSTLARTWCRTRQSAVHVELDGVRALIVAGAADPQEQGDLHHEQYGLSAHAAIALARVFLSADYDVVIDDVFYADAFERVWQPLLDGTEWRLVVVVPSIEDVLRHSRAREKRIREEHSRLQHEVSQAWPPEQRIDTSGRTIEDGLKMLQRKLRPLS